MRISSSEFQLSFNTIQACFTWERLAMYHYQEGSSWTDGEVASSRPDALLASGGAFFLPLGHHHHQQQEEVQSPFHRAMSTGDLTLVRDEEQQLQQQRMAMVAPPVRYSAEERRERIDKYRNKRNHRNFQKKITYACRKTLADSRPRVKGRFARGGGEYYADAEADAAIVQAAAMSESQPVNDLVVTTGEASGDDSASMPEWWPAMQEALATDVVVDEEVLAAYLGVSSISLYSPSCSPSAST